MSMTPFKTNKLKYELDRTALAERYDVIKVKKDGGHFKRGANCLDIPVMGKMVCAVRFEQGDSFHVLMEKNLNNRSLLQDALKQSDDIEKICFPPVTFDDVDDRTVLQLLLNSLGTSLNENLRINNLTGHLYCYKSAWLKKNSDNEIEQVSCLEIFVTKDMQLTLPVRTFTSGKCKNFIFFSRKHPYESYPKYVFSRFQTMARKTKGVDSEEFIQRQKYNCKFDVDFLKLDSKDGFFNSKMGVLTEIVERFNSKFAGLAKIDFDVIPEYVSLERVRVQMKEDDEIRKKALKDQKFRIIDLVKDEKSKEFCAKTQEKLEELSGIKPSLGESKIKDGLNICLVHKKEWYKDKDDVYGTVTGTAVQHITIDDKFKNKKAQLNSVINELLVKHDIRKKRFSLYDWSKAGFENDISFGLRFKEEDDEKEKFCFITVHPDGTFDFCQKDPTDIFDFNVYTQCVQIFQSSDDICGVVMNHENQINVIKKTDWITLPEFEKINDEFKIDRTHKFRSEEGRDEFLNACLDIKMFDKDGGKYYFVGTIGLGMQSSIPNAVNIRRIEPYDGAPLFFEKLLPLMNATFVRNQRMTVIPFPFKYLREWVSLDVK